MTRKILTTLAAALALVGCRAETATVLEILDVPQWETDCTLSATPAHFQGVGMFDPLGWPFYRQLYYMENNALESTTTITGGNRLNSAANDANIIGFDVCFFRGDDPRVVGYNPAGKGLVLSCDDVPGNQRLFVPSSGTVTSGGGTVTSGFNVLDFGQLETLFGQGLTQLTALGAADVIVQFRARAKTQSGSLVRSNWFAFTVVVAPGFSDVKFLCPAGFAQECAVYWGGPFTCNQVASP